IETDIQVAAKENQRRIIEAQTKREAVIAEVRGQVQAQVAEARAQVGAWDARIEQVRRKLEADVVAPAIAAKQKSEQAAKASAAQIVAEGSAGAFALTALAQAYKNAGPRARDALLLQKLVPIFEQLTSTMKDIHVDRLTVLGIGGNNAGNGAASLGATLLSANEQVRASTGVDLLGAVGVRLPASVAVPTDRR
ncbi:MAG: hypothetical protein WCJ30_04755, partial [Deltaproteobacteria bacterium]